MLILIFYISFSILVGVVGKDRKIGFGIALICSLLLSPLIGIVITLLSEKTKNSQNKHKYKHYLEAGKKAEYKGQSEVAIDNYMDALFHLENDYKGMEKTEESKRLQLITAIKGKINNLKQSL